MCGRVCVRVWWEGVCVCECVLVCGWGGMRVSVWWGGCSHSVCIGT